MTHYTVPIRDKTGFRYNCRLTVATTRPSEAGKELVTPQLKGPSGEYLAGEDLVRAITEMGVLRVTRVERYAQGSPAQVFPQDFPPYYGVEYWRLGTCIATENRAVVHVPFLSSNHSFSQTQTRHTGSGCLEYKPPEKLPAKVTFATAVVKGLAPRNSHRPTKSRANLRLVSRRV